MSSLPAPRPRGAPDHVAVVGAGMVGLATAHFLLELGIRVTVLERDRVGAGASWGNAGWLTPGLATPLPEPAVLRYGLRTLLSTAAPVYVPLAADANLARFLAGFLRNCTASRFRAAARTLTPLTRRAFEAFDAMAAAGVAAPTRSATPFVAAFRDGSARQALLDELSEVRAAGQPVEAEVLDGRRARELEPVLSERIGAAVLVHGQRFCDPGRFVAALADSVRERGGIVREAVLVEEVADGGTHVRLTVVEGAVTDTERYDAVVIANGAWMPGLARRFGVVTPVQAGRGYSLSVPVDPEPTGPIYFPAARLACTPLSGGLRLAGTMEFRGPDAPGDPKRVAAMLAAARPLLRGVDLAAATPAWVGPRPCTPDGLPLIGRTTSPRVFVAGGHGMWGITLGPITGRLLANAIVEDRLPDELAPFDPLRRR